MEPSERFGLSRDEYEKCVQAAEELRGLWPEAPAPSPEELARAWAEAKAAQCRRAVAALWRALGFQPTPWEGARSKG